MNVRILATCRKPELLDAMLLVFKTIRVGFPTANIDVYSNGGSVFGDLEKACKETECRLRGYYPTIHHEWIKNLLFVEDEPFFLCDTDMVFWKSCENWKFETAIAGELIPRFHDRFSRCDIQPRLHTALLYMDPVVVRAMIKEWESSVTKTQFTPTVDLVNPLVIPCAGTPMFFDTCSFLYHAIGGQRFNPEQIEAFAHLNCGTWVDMIESSYPGMTAFHQAVYKDHRNAVGLRAMQKAFYDQHAA